ncbi:MAG: RNA polymerase sigma factor [Flavobacteriales bacterium]
MTGQPVWLEELQHPRSSAARERAFRQLIAEFQLPVYRPVRRLLGNHADADDATQETFIQVHRSIGSFRREAPFQAWILTIAGRKALDLIARRRTREMSLDMAFEQAERALVADPLFHGDAAERALHAAVLALPERQRQVFVLRYFDEVPYAEIATTTGVTEGALKASYHHAAEKVRRFVTALPLPID